jgi:hypothetical protein
MIKFVNDVMAIDYARRKVCEEHAAKGWTTVSVGNGVGDDVSFIGAWERGSDGSMVWTADE